MEEIDRDHPLSHPTTKTAADLFVIREDWLWPELQLQVWALCEAQL